MNAAIAGMGWVTPLGSDVGEVVKKLQRGERAHVEQISDGADAATYPVMRVPETALRDLPRHARLRRASGISRFAAAAGLAALDAARKVTGEIDIARTGLVFAVSNGGVNYTKRFYHDIVASGAQSASPLLFPETVFNAAASHLAALLDVRGLTYTLVGDGAIGMAAVQMAAELLEADALDHCLVVAAEEADWLLCDAYHRWRLFGNHAPDNPALPNETTLSEGAGALFISRTGPIVVEQARGGIHYRSRDDAARRLRGLVEEIAGPDVALVVSGANGTFVDAIEAEALGPALSGVTTMRPKFGLGESVGASAIWQAIVAAHTLAGMEKNAGARRALAISCGLNQQIGGLGLAC